MLSAASHAHTSAQSCADTDARPGGTDTNADGGADTDPGDSPDAHGDSSTQTTTGSCRLLGPGSSRGRVAWYNNSGNH